MKSRFGVPVIIVVAGLCLAACSGTNAADSPSESSAASAHSPTTSSSASDADSTADILFRIHAVGTHEASTMELELVVYAPTALTSAESAGFASAECGALGAGVSSVIRSQATVTSTSGPLDADLLVAASAGPSAQVWTGAWTHGQAPCAAGYVTGTGTGAAEVVAPVDPAAPAGAIDSPLSGRYGFFGDSGVGDSSGYPLAISECSIEYGPAAAAAQYPGIDYGNPPGACAVGSSS